MQPFGTQTPANNEYQHAPVNASNVDNFFQQAAQEARTVDLQNAQLNA